MKNGTVLLSTSILAYELVELKLINSESINLYSVPGEKLKSSKNACIFIKIRLLMKIFYSSSIVTFY